MNKLLKVILSFFIFFQMFYGYPDIRYTGQPINSITTTTVDIDAWTEITATTLSATTTTVSFSSIDQTYDHLKIVAVARSVRSGADNDTMVISLNSDTTDSNYLYGEFIGDGGLSSGFAADADGRQFADVPGATSASGDFAVIEILIPNYTNTNINTAVKGVNVVRFSATQGREGFFGLFWENTAAVTDIDLTLVNAQYAANSTFQLYGMKTQTVLASASGNAITDSDWTVSGNNAYYSQSGNVGIGDTTPDYKLDVSGTIATDNDIIATGGIATGGDSIVVKVKTVQIGDWDMDTDATITVAHGLSDFFPVAASGGIINDTGGTFRIIGNYTAANATAPTDLGIDKIDATEITLKRGSAMDNTSYDQTSYNRGYVVIWYIDV